MNRCARGALASLMVIGLGIATTACGDDDRSPDVTVDLNPGSGSDLPGSDSVTTNDSVTTMSPGSVSTTSTGANRGASNNGGGTGITATTAK